MQRGSNYELVVLLGCKPSANPLSDIRNVNIFASFSSAVSVCEPLNISVVGGKLFCCTVTVCVIIVFSLLNQKVSRGQEQEQVFVTELTDQVSTFVELKLLL